MLIDFVEDIMRQEDCNKETLADTMIPCLGVIRMLNSDFPLEIFNGTKLLTEIMYMYMEPNDGPVISDVIVI